MSCSSKGRDLLVEFAQRLAEDHVAAQVKQRQVPQPVNDHAEALWHWAWYRLVISSGRMVLRAEGTGL